MCAVRTQFEVASIIPAEKNVLLPGFSGGNNDVANGSMDDVNTSSSSRRGARSGGSGDRAREEAREPQVSSLLILTR